MKTHLLLIDPQNDFCDPNQGTLFVPGADADIARLAALVARLGDAIDGVHVTLDTHHTVDIAHPCWWSDTDGNPPAPFTIISRDGGWRTANPSDQARSDAYLDALAANGRYPLCIWPYHCLVGSVGAAVVPTLHRAITDWERTTQRSAQFHVKGLNPFTEHYSAVAADVPDPTDPATLPNRALLESLADADRVLIGGEAGSHCVASTVRDLVHHGVAANKIILLTDGFSPVAGFEPLQALFLTELHALGAQLIPTEEL